MKLYHGTNQKGLTVLKPSYGRFGTAIYFSREVMEAKVFGEYIIEVHTKGDIREIRYNDLIKYVPSLNIDEEEEYNKIIEIAESDPVDYRKTIKSLSGWIKDNAIEFQER